MPPFQYAPWSNPNAGSIGELLARGNDAAARAAEVSGNAWARAGENIAHIPGQLLEQRDAARRDALAERRNALAEQEATRRGKLTDLQLDEAEQGKRTRAIVDALPFYASGQGRDAILASLDGSSRELAQKRYQDADEAAARLEQVKASTTAANLNADQSRQAIAAGALDIFGAHGAGVLASKYDAGQFYSSVADLVHKQVMSPTEAGPIIARAMQDPTSIQPTVDRWVAQSPQQQQLLERRKAAEAAATNTATDNARQDAAAKEAARHNRAVEANSAANDSAAPELTGAGLDAAARMYATTGQLPAMGMGGKAANVRAGIINRAAELYPGLDIAGNKAVYGADTDTLKKLTTQRGAIGAFEQTAQKNIDIFLEQAKHVVDTKSPLLNTPVRLITGKVLGAPNQAAYDAARQVAVNEIAKITSNPTLAGQLSDSARHEVEAFNPQNATLAQSIAVMKVLKQDMTNRATSLDDEITAVKKRIHEGNAPPARAAGAGPAGAAAAPKADPLGIR